MGRLFYVFVHLVEQYCKTSDIPGNYLTSLFFTVLTFPKEEEQVFPSKICIWHERPKLHLAENGHTYFCKISTRICEDLKIAYTPKKGIILIFKYLHAREEHYILESLLLLPAVNPQVTSRNWRCAFIKSRSCIARWSVYGPAEEIPFGQKLMTSNTHTIVKVRSRRLVTKFAYLVYLLRHTKRLLADCAWSF